jgi:hypothetical protein
MITLHVEVMDAESTDEEIEARMEELCAEHPVAYATCEKTSAGYRIVLTDEPQQ